MARQPVTILPLGGYGEFGRNATLVFDGALERGPCVMVDAGGQVADGTLPGIEQLLPDLGFVAALGERLQAYLLTHGHEDHVAALPHLLARRPAPVYASAYCAALLEPRLREAGLNTVIQVLQPGQRCAVGPFTVEPVAVSHSMPGALALALQRDEMRLVFSGDFRVDLDPVEGPPTDLARLRALGDAGVALLVADSTGARTPGHNPGERAVRQPLREALAGATGRVIVTTFCSHVGRLKQLLDLAQELGRRAVMVGRAAQEHTELALRRRLLEPPPGLLLDSVEALSCPPAELLVIATGCQGEPRAALPRMAHGAPELPPVERGDTVVLSARVIPGNEVAVLRMANALARRGVELVWGHQGVHVSGHGHADDLRELIAALRPAVLVPGHGDRLHLEACGRLGQELGTAPAQVALLEDGHPIEVFPEGDSYGYRGLPPVELRPVMVEAGRVVEDSSTVVAARRNAGLRGALCVAVPLRPDGRPRPGPAWIKASGVDADGLEELLQRCAVEVGADLAQSARDAALATPQLEETAQRAVRRAFRRRGLRAPQILVVVVPD